MNPKSFLSPLLLVIVLAPAWAQRPADLAGAGRVPDGSAPRQSAAPAAGRGFFASFDYLSYNAATTVDARGGVHLAFYFSNERHEEDPLHCAQYEEEGRAWLDAIPEVDFDAHSTFPKPPT